MRENSEFLKLRSAMKWGIKTKTSTAVNGALVPAIENKIFVPVKFLEVPHMYNIKKMIEKNPVDIWNRYPGELWIKVLDMEIKYQEHRVNTFIEEVMKLEFNMMADLFKEHRYAILHTSIDQVYM